jgi:hypothetical protein
MSGGIANENGTKDEKYIENCVYLCESKFVRLDLIE